MKRKLLLLSVMVICIAIAAVGTLAFFNSDAVAHNVITTGGVDIELHEYADAEKTPFPSEGLDGVMPGMTVTKIAEVENTGASAAWVRVKVEKAIKLAKEIEGFTPDTALVALNINTEKWEHEGDYFYYKEALQPNEITAPIFTSVTFNKTMGNEYQGATATVDIVAQAVQTANNGDSALTAKGWPASETGVESGVTG